MAIKRGRCSPFLPEDDTPSVKQRGLPESSHSRKKKKNSNNSHDQCPATCNISMTGDTKKAGSQETIPVLEPQPVFDTDAVFNEPLEHNDTNMVTSSSSSPLGLVVIAPEFDLLHESWETFEQALKMYGKATYQSYVIRSTTSVKRRNFKILETREKGGDVITHDEALAQRLAMDHEDGDKTGRNGEKILIPEWFLWYSKSLKCTHGWKHRHRGTGKRGSGVVRSTSCPAKMCVTLQHRGSGPDDWKVVVTKHVRTHNHPLSKELYLYYTENRRIYDPELLAVGGETREAAKPSVDMTNAYGVSVIEQATQRTGWHHILPSSNEQSQREVLSTVVGLSDSSAVLSPSSIGNTNDDCTSKDRIAPSDTSSGNVVAQSRMKTGTFLTGMPPLGAMVLTPGTILSKAIDGGGVCVPRVSRKIFTSWDAFHDFIAQYSFDTAQVFRTRSTVSIAARNAKIVASIAAKSGRDSHDVASYASTPPPSRLIPEKYKWFSKLLICTYGWKRRARSRGGLVGEHNGEGPCPAMLLARMERNINGDWYVVINRQVQKHNHRLNNYFEEAGGNSLVLAEPVKDTTDVLATASSVDSIAAQWCSSGKNSSELETEPMIETSTNDTLTETLDRREIVVRVPKLQSVFRSWDDFHASLKVYSDATYQLYRTRTTSSVKGRNKKIAQMERGGGDEANDKSSESESGHEALSNEVNVARKIPESWRWYSKTLTCTHGWKERHRGAGKRSAHGVRSTACPVKICATAQYITLSKFDDSDTTDDSCVVTSDSFWRVVVTKHIVDHNHNLSRELYQHYCENRRIYNPELLAIDMSNNSLQLTRKDCQGPRDQSILASGTSKECIVSVGGQTTSQSHALLTKPEVRLVETVNHADESYGSFGDSLTVKTVEATNVQQTAATLPISAGVGQTVPPVALAPCSATTSYLPTRASGQDHQQLQQQHEDQQQQKLATCGGSSTEVHLERGHARGGNAVALTSMITSGITSSSNLVVSSNTGTAITGGIPPLGSSVISIACRIHGSSAGTNLAFSEPSSSRATTTLEIHESGSPSTPAAQCACFKIAGGSNIISIVPASEPLASSETSLNGVEDEAMLYDEDIDGGWQPSSHVEIEKVTHENGETIWQVPRIVLQYPSWEEFHTYLDAYSAATFQLYRVRTTYSVRSRNVRLRQLAASRGLLIREGENGDSTRCSIETEQEGVHGLSRAHLVPERYEWYSKTFLCTHGWKRRSRGSGQRISHNIRAAECPAKVCATLQRSEVSNKWNVVVTKHLAEHNHELSKAVYLQYSEVRRVRDPQVLAQAEQIWRGGVTRRRVFEYLKERSPHQIILMKDVHNLVQRWQSRERRPRQEQQENSIEDQAVQQQQPKSNAPLDVSASHGDESSSWL